MRRRYILLMLVFGFLFFITANTASRASYLLTKLNRGTVIVSCPEESINPTVESNLMLPCGSAVMWNLDTGDLDDDNSDTLKRDGWIPTEFRIPISSNQMTLNEAETFAFPQKEVALPTEVNDCIYTDLDCETNCPSNAYLLQGNPSELISIDLSNGNSTVLGVLPKNVNAVGFNQKDGRIWGMSRDELSRINKDLTLTSFSIEGLPRSFSGDVNKDGFYLSLVDDNAYVVDLNSVPPTMLKTCSLPISDIAPDIAFSSVDNLAYLVGTDGGVLYKLNIENCELSTVGTITGIPSFDGGGNFGAFYMDNDGNLFLSKNSTGEVYIIDTPHLGNAEGRFFTQSRSSNSNDGARCALAKLEMCLNDIDQDGICDEDDLDDDNDGILDTEENAACDNPSIELVGLFDDFGTGTSRTTIPYINRDFYSFKASGSLADGSYAIINGTNPQAANYSDWESFEDHTPGDTNGRMLVINASFDSGEFYRRTLGNIMPNIDVSLSFWVRDICPPCDIRPNITYSIEDASGTVLVTKNTGDIPSGWQEYSINVSPGTNSTLQLLLVNNSPGGNGNDLAIDDISFRQAICDSDGDGIADSQETDSDGDGCPDATEGIGNFTGMDLDANDMLVGEEDANGVPSIANGGQNVGSSKDVTMNNCCNDIQAIINPPDILDCKTTTIELNGANSVDADAYEWSTIDGNIVASNTGAIINVDTPGTYSLEVTSSSGCTSMESIRVNSDTSPPMTSINPPAVITCNLQQVTLDASVITNAISYRWTTSTGVIIAQGNTTTPIVGAAGEYTITTTAANGCTASSSIVVTEDIQRPIVSIVSPTSLNCAIRQITLDASASTTNASYQWSTMDGNIVSGGNTLQPIVNATGNYSLTITTANGCTASQRVFVPIDDSSPIAEAGTGGTLTCVTTSLQLDGTFSQDVASYEWTTSNGTIVSGGTTARPTVNQAGIYTLEVTASNGCMSSDEVEILVDTTEPIARIDAPSLLTCKETSVLLDGASSQNVATYAWSTMDGNITGAINTAVITVDGPGTYTLVVTAANGCTSSTTIQVNEGIMPPSPSIQPPATLTCALQQITLDASATTNAISYVWTSTDGIILSGGTTLIPVVGSDGTYTLTATGSNGCTATASVTVSKDAGIPNAIIATPSELTCNIRSITLDGSASTPNATYQWTTVDGSISSGGNSLQPTVDATGTYRLVVTTPNGCSIAAEVVVKTDNSTPVAEAGQGATLTCTTTSYQLDASLSQNVISYQWTTANGNIVSGANTPTPEVDQAGIYTLLVTGSNGCTASDAVEILLDTTEPSAIISAPSLLTCLTTSILLDGTTSRDVATYEWSTVDGNIVGDNNSGVITIDEPGIYRLLVMAANGCTSATTVRVNEDITLPNPVIQPPAILTCNLQQVTLDASTTVDAVSYVWTTQDGFIVLGGNTAAAIASDEGTYTVVATAVNGCTASATVTVNKDSSVPDAVINTPDFLSCTIREITLNGVGSTEGATYQWTTVDGNIVSGATTLQPVVSASGIYRLEVMTTNGCSDKEEIFVPVNENMPFADAGIGTTLTCATTTYQLDASLSQNVISYQWTTIDGNIVSNPNTSNPVIDQAGIYTLVVTGANGCTSSNEVEIQQDIIPPTVDMLQPDLLTCSVTSITLDASTSQNVASFSWSSVEGNIVGANNTIMITVDAPGRYDLVVTGANGCTANMSMVVNQEANIPPINIAPAETLTCSNMKIRLDGSSTIPELTYVWTTANGIILEGDKTAAPLVADEGTYTVVVTDANGCKNSASIMVQKDESVPNAMIVQPDTLTCNDLFLEVVGSSSDEIISAQWSTTDGSIIGETNTLTATVHSAGTYRLVVTQANGCTDAEEVYVSQNNKVPFAEAGLSKTLTCASPTAQLDASLSQNVIQYEWSTADGNIVSGANTARPLVDAPGTYLVIVMGRNGCKNSDQVKVTSDVLLPTVGMLPPATLTCTTTKIVLDASPSRNIVTYEWSTQDGNIIGPNNGITIEVDAVGTYDLIVTADNGCTASMSMLVNQDRTLPTAQIAPSALLSCNLTSIRLDGSQVTGGLQYIWTTTDGQIVSDANTPAPLVNQPGTYTLTTTNGYGCQSSTTVEVQQDSDSPILTITQPAELTCTNTMIRLNATVSIFGGRYQWFTADGNIVSGADGLTPVVNEPGEYELMVELPNGCTSFKEVIVTQNIKVPFAEPGSEKVITCANPSVTLDASKSQNAIGYEWTTDIGNILGANNNIEITVDAKGIYTLITTGANGCTAANQVEVLEDKVLPTVNMLPPDRVTCEKPIVVLDASPSEGVVRYEWSTSDGNIVTGATTMSPSVDAPGTYLMQATAANGCIAEMSVPVLTDVDLPVALIDLEVPLTCGQMERQLNGVSSQNAVAYNWGTSDGEILAGGSSPNPTIRGMGTYSLTVRGSNGCTHTSSIMIDEDEMMPTVRIAAPPVITCAIQEISLDGTATTDAVSYLWRTDNGQIVGHRTEAKVRVSKPGLYILEATGANGCMGQQSVMVEQNIKLPIADAGTSIPITCTRQQVTLDGTASVNAVSYKWTTTNGVILSNSNDPIIEVGQFGNYTLEVIGENGCSSEDVIQVDFDLTPPEAIIVHPKLLGCTNKSISLDGRSLSKRAVSYEWATVDGNFLTSTAQGVVEVDQPGIYTLRVTSQNGCTHRAEVVVNVDDTLPSIILLAAKTLTCDLTSQVLDASRSTDVASYHWTTSNGRIVSGNYSATPTINAPGTYRLVVTAANGCARDTDVLVEQDITIPTLTIVPPINITCANPSIQLQATASSGVRYEWTTLNGNIVANQNTASPTIDAAGTYSVLVTGESGCSNLESVSVREKKENSFNSLTASICSGDTYMAGGKLYNKRGFYVDTLFNANQYGCDSILTIDVRTRFVPTTRLDILLCKEEVFEINGKVYENDGDYTENFQGQARNGCDSIVHFTVTRDATSIPIEVPSDLTISCDDLVPTNDVETPRAADLLEFLRVEEIRDSASCSYTIYREWTTIDRCLNRTTKSQRIHVTDDIPPMIEQLPDITLESCDYDFPTPLITDNCDEDIEVIFEQKDLNESACADAITRSWTAIDNCGNTSTFQQNVTFKDDQAPTITFQLPALVNAKDGDTISYNCGAAPNIDITSAWFKDNCDSPLETNFKEIAVNNTGCFLLLYCEWQAEDICQNKSSIGFYIKTIDEEAPTLSEYPSDVALSQDADFPAPPSIKVTDNCDSYMSIDLEEVLKEKNCKAIMERTWTVVDNCGNSTIHTQLLERPLSNCQTSEEGIDIATSTTTNACSIPTAIRTEQIEDRKVAIEWEEITGAIEYEIYIRTQRTAIWKFKLTSRKNSIISSTPPNTYEVKVRAICGDGSYSDWSDIHLYRVQEFNEESSSGHHSKKPTYTELTVLLTTPITVFPNPSQGELFIKYPFQKGMKIIVRDITGQHVCQKDITVDGSLSQLYLNNPAGLYFISVIATDGQLLQSVDLFINN